MYSMSSHFKIIIPMFNCSLWATKCLDSVIKQKYKDWQAIVAIDPSTDNTVEVVSSFLKSNRGHNIILLNNNVRKHVPKNQIDAIDAANPNNEDVLIFLDGDDWLYDNTVLDYLNHVYSDESIWITWGNYVYSHNNKVGGASGIYPNTNNIRNVWQFSHLKTFKYFLWKNINHSDLKQIGTDKYYTVAGDMAVMYPMVEMAGKEHSKFIEKIMYVYNYSSPYNDDKINRTLGHKFATEIRKRTPYSKKTKQELVGV